MSPSEIARLDIPPWKEAILRALAEYGGYVGDTGDAPWSVQVESPRSYTSFDEEDPFDLFAWDVLVPRFDGVAYFDIASGVDWRRYLRVLAPSHPALASGSLRATAD